MSYKCTAHDVICAEKQKNAKKTLLELQHLTWLVYFPPIILLLILQWHTGVCEETFDINSKMAKKTQNIWNFISTRNDKLRRLAGRFQTLIWRPGKRFKIWSLPDYLGELTMTLRWMANLAKKMSWLTSEEVRFSLSPINSSCIYFLPYSHVNSCVKYIVCVRLLLACSRRSDSGERCEVKRGAKK